MTSPPQGPYCPRRPTLKNILENEAAHPWTLSAFSAFLSQNLALENLEFYMDAQRYKAAHRSMVERSLTDSSSPSKVNYREDDRVFVCSLFQRLLAAYIMPNAPKEVNITGAVREALLAERSRNPDIPPDPLVLEQAIKKVKDLMEESLYFPFLNSVALPSDGSGYDSKEDLISQPSQAAKKRGPALSNPPFPTSSVPDMLPSAWSHSRPASQTTNPDRFVGGRQRQHPQKQASTGSSAGSTRDTITTTASPTASTPISASTSPESLDTFSPPGTSSASDLHRYSTGNSPRPLKIDTPWRRMSNKLGLNRKKNGRGREAGGGGGANEGGEGGGASGTAGG